MLITEFTEIIDHFIPSSACSNHESNISRTAGGKEISVGTEEVKVIDTIAAGDSFNAGLLFELDKQKMLDQEKLASIETSELKKALTFANQVASFTVTQKGANPPWMYQIK